MAQVQAITLKLGDVVPSEGTIINIARLGTTLIVKFDDDHTRRYWVNQHVDPMFDPASVSGLQLRLDEGGLAGLADGDAVATWADQSGQGHNATQATAGHRPICKTNILNGYAVVRFDAGLGQSLALGDLSAAFPHAATLVAVATPTAAKYCVYETTPGGDGWWRYNGDGTGYMKAFLANRASGYPVSPPASGSHIWVIESTSTHYRIWLDGVDQGEIASPGYSGGTAHVVGQGAEYMTGDIATILAYDSALDSADRTYLQAGLQSKYGV